MKFFSLALLVGLYAISAVAFDAAIRAQQQRDIWELFKYINQPSDLQTHVNIANTFHFWDHKDLFTKPEVVEHFQQYWRYGTYLRKGKIFLVFNEEHLKQAVALFKLFYYANNYETFYKTAVWARQHINEGLFVYSFSLAVVHKPETQHIGLPFIHEIHPHYFFNTETIFKAQSYKQMLPPLDPYNKIIKIIYSNYSGHYLNLHSEQSMSYFLEDVDVNSFYYYFNLYHPFWMTDEESQIKYNNRGQLFHYMHQQILARYYLERLSNSFGEIEHFDWDLPFEIPYYPSLTYPNGLEFPTRPHFAKLHEYFYNYGHKWTSKHKYSYIAVQDYERRIHDAIDSGYVYTDDGKKMSILGEDGFNALGNLIEGNPNSAHDKYYGGFPISARHLLGYSCQALDHHLRPSALEHFETSMRDPAFYMLYKKLITYFYRYKYQHVKPYTEKDLYFNDVVIENVEFEPLITYFGYHSYDLTNAIYVKPEEYLSDSFTVQAAHYRLNHESFTYKIYVKADKPIEASVHVYMGPKYDEYGRYINLTENYMNFVQFDHFTYKLNAGQNAIVRDSSEIQNYMRDKITCHEGYENIVGIHDLYSKSYSSSGETNTNFFGYTFPNRFILPKGDYGGVPYQFFVIVSKYIDYKPVEPSKHLGCGNKHVDGYPLGYPFDKPIYSEKMFYDMPNGFFYETKVYHSHHVDSSE